MTRPAACDSSGAGEHFTGIDDMSQGDDPVLREILDRAADLPPDRRSQFLDQACGADAGLRARLDALLDSLQEGDRFLANPTVDRAAMSQWHDARDPPGRPDLRERAGMRVGNYKLLQLIGEGGFGTVFMAEQEKPVRRRVALKIIKPGMDSAAVIARFEAERQALAMMDHPNIAHIYDAGATDAGRPYFVMELVQGIPITQYCDRKRLTPRERLQLFIPVCHAIQHAHQKGIIHRDLKPSNILVMIYDGKPVPKVIDFGVAKALHQRLTEKTLFTQFGNAVGTPEYMSPEQAEMDVLGADTRSDIYSLGVLLYELLTGSTPIDRKKLLASGYAQMLRIIREEEPPRPSTRLSSSGEALASISADRGTDSKVLTKTTAGDLDWIVMKCLEKDRGRRYESASALARELERYLRDEPVEASPPSAADKIRRFARKHRVSLGVSGGIVSVLIAATIVSTWQAVRATRARSAMLVEKQRADEQVAIVGAVNDFLNDDVLGQAVPSKQGRGTPDPDLKVRDALDRAATRIDTRFKTQPRVAAKIHGTIGMAYQDLGLYEKARQHREKAVELSRQAGGEDDPDTFKALCDLGEACWWQHRYADAERFYLEALRGRQKVLGNDNRSTLESLADLGTFYAWNGRYSEAEPLLLKALQTRRKLFGDGDKDTLDALARLADMFQWQRQYAKAEPLLIEVAQTKRKVLGADDPEAFDGIRGLADLYEKQELHSKAEPLYQQALAGKRKLLTEQHPDVLSVLSKLAWVYQHQLQFEKAEPLRRQVLSGYRATKGDTHPDTIGAMNDLGVLYMDEDQDQKAEPFLVEALQASRKVSGEQHYQTLNQTANLALCYTKQGQYAKAEPLYLLALEGFHKTQGEQHPDTLDILFNLAEMYAAERKYAKAEPLYLEALEGRRKSLGEQHRDTLLTLFNLAYMYARQKEYGKALPLALQVLAANRQTFGARHHNTMASQYLVAQIYFEQKEYSKAEPLLREISEAAVAAPGGGSGERVPPDAVETFIDCLNRSGKYGEAMEWRPRLRRLLESSLGEQVIKTTAGLTGGPGDAAPLYERGRMYAQLGRFAEAAHDFRKAIELKPDEHMNWHQGLPLLLETGDLDEYRRLRPEALQRFASADDAVADRIAKACMMLPGSAQEMNQANALADRALAIHPNEQWFWFCKGLAEYRCGRDQQALAWFGKNATDDEPRRESAAQFYSAMALQHLGRPADARAALARGTEIMETKLPKAGEGDLTAGNFQDWILCDLARKEAETIIRGQRAATHPLTAPAADLGSRNPLADPTRRQSRAYFP